MRDVSICCLVQRLQFSKNDLIASVRAMDSFGVCAIPNGELSIAFLDDDTVRVMHGEFLGDATSTDVITFPGDMDKDFAGEICISVECAAQNAQDSGTEISEELMLYVIHGWLHLAGLGDGTAEEAAEMRRREKDVMDFLRKRNLMVDFSISSADQSC